MMGDPGTAKSQLLKFVEKTASCAVYTTGNTTTQAVSRSHSMQALEASQGPSKFTSCVPPNNIVEFDMEDFEAEHGRWVSIAANRFVTRVRAPGGSSWLIERDSRSLGDSSKYVKQLEVDLRLSEFLQRHLWLFVVSVGIESTYVSENLLGPWMCDLVFSDNVEIILTEA